MNGSRTDITLAGANLTLAGLSPATLQTWDTGAWRGPRLLVPVMLEALVVTAQTTAGPWAKIRFDPALTTASKSGVLDQPKPFEEDKARPVGVHLHWALPDGLTRGRQVREAAPPAAPPAATTSEVRDKPPGETISFPLVPDRWLVVRLQPGATPDARRSMTVWIIESEGGATPAVRVIPIATWKEKRPATPRILTAVGKGDAAYAAYYDNVENRLAFYDALTGVPSGPLTYAVAGWYSKAEEDPLFAPRTRGEWFDRLRELRWGLVDANTSRIDSLAAEIRDRLMLLNVTMDRQVRSRGTRAKAADLAREKSSRARDRVSGATDVPPGVTPGVSPGIAPGMPPLVMPLPSTPEFRVDPRVGGLPGLSADALATSEKLFTSYWPRQVLCHGMIYDVRWNNVGGSYDSAESGRPAAGTVSVAVGNTGVEALSALIASRAQALDLEKVYAAFQYGLLNEIDEPDGVAHLDALLHEADFAALPGGYVTETIEEGDVVPRGPGAGPGRDIPEPGPAMGVRMDFAPSRNNLGELVAEVAGRSGAEPLRIRRRVQVQRAMPRYWQPNDPVILLTDPRRSLKHGADGIYSQDGSLKCRISGDTVKSLGPIVGRNRATNALVRLTIVAQDVCNALPDSGQLPFEAADLVTEALLLDEVSAPVVARTILNDAARLNSVAPTATVARDNLSFNDLVRKIRVEQTLPWTAVANPQADAQAVGALSGITGKMPSKLAVQPWRAPWTPLHLDWQVGWYPSPGLERDWQLGEIDYEGPTGPDLGTSPAKAITYTGRSLLTPGVVSVLRAQITKFLADEAQRTTDLATPAQERALGDVIAALNGVDVLATSLGGLNGQFIGRVEAPWFTKTGDTPPAPDATFTETAGQPLFPVRAGHMRLARLRIIDGFSQVYDVDQARLAAPIRAADMVTPPPPAPTVAVGPVAPVGPVGVVIGGPPIGIGGPGRVPGPRLPPPPPANRSDLLRLPPRIVPPCRLMFRFLSATDDAIESTKERSPICGWVLPDHLDEALEVYDAQGAGQGQIQLEVTGAALKWEGVPGRPDPAGAMPSLPNAHLQHFVRALVGWGIRDAAADEASTGRSESALSALLRMIDATLWSVDPLGRTGSEHLALVVGRPLAIVRAQVHLEVDGTLAATASRQLRQTVFPVRLGELTHVGDGLIGYFVNDDYSQFYPIHESIAAQTRPAGRQEGFLSGIQDVPGYYSNFDQAAKPVTHPYINTAPLVLLRPDQRVTLTLLVDPRGGVHATAGIVPRKRIDLYREHVAPALDAMAVTFRIGPVLTDPAMVRMPLPAEIRGGWSWVSRTSVSTWGDDPVTRSGDDTLPTGTAKVVEGWLRLAQALSSS